MDFKDYYSVMGIKRDASQDEVKSAYRKLARQYHPDVSKRADAEERFKELGEAYAVLKDPEKRAAYDQLGSNWKAGQDFQPPPDWDAGFEFSGGGFGGGGASAYSDFFESLFGRGFRSSRSDRQSSGFNARGEDHHAKVLVDLEDAYRGATRSISLRAPAIDSTGHVTTKQRTLNVRIPKGVKQGQRIRLSGQGTPGVGQGPAGDLYLEIEFNPHRLYRVEGRDVYLDVPVTPWEAALGATIKVPTPDGAVELKVPEGTTHGRKLRLKKRGIPGEPPGDLYVSLLLTLPAADSEAARQLYRKMQQDHAYNPRSTMGV
ncbi:MAG: DnaJ domain-containing protein [Gammaproteobacteria bacterium]|nr:DnaJ domain-containing protein [Gammaproteobacteria bacterium]MDH5345516.1 DnaJ domain-containing protein [Gammaproteobacteria bacterium]